MSDSNKVLPFASLQAGNHDEFQQLTDPYRRELLVHCYRILGSIEDAEDALQEALFRAWRRLDSLRVETSLRAWLYRIATNISLDMLDSRKARLMPPATHAPADPDSPLPGPVAEPLWLDPLPDDYLASYAVSPEATVEAQESLSLAFLAALQQLPGRQRAILILRDVLGWKAQEVADLLDLSVAAVNSALQRARATLKSDRAANRRTLTASDKARTDALLDRYVQAWQAADSASLIALLQEDAILTMPPLPAWYRGPAAIRAFLDRFLFSGPEVKRLRLKATRANGCPAFIVYEADASGAFHPAGLQILELDGDRIARIDDFLALDQNLFEKFSFPVFN